MSDPVAGSRSAQALTHVDGSGHARMVDVSQKQVTTRTATASARVRMSPETAQLLMDGGLPKGEALPVVRLAGVMGAKHTPDLIPLCHVIALTGVEVEVEIDVPAGVVDISATARAADRTGVEMEAMVAASTSALTLYDMTKAVDKGIVIEQVRLEAKTGGKSGDWFRKTPAQGTT